MKNSYPNTASGYFTFKWPEKNYPDKYSLIVYNRFGLKNEEIAVPEDNFHDTIYTDNWKKGLYLISVNCYGHKIGLCKIIKD